MLPILLLRLLPLINGVLGFIMAREQWKWTDVYPWPLVAHITAFAFSMGLIGWKRISPKDFVEKMSLPLLAMIATGTAFLVFEEEWVHGLLTGAMAFISFFSLELFFVSQYHSMKYPLNGLSRWNMALIPCIGFLGGAVLQGIQTFLLWPMVSSGGEDAVLWPLWIEPVILAVVGAVAYIVTSHPTATRPLRIKWMMLGALIGLQIGILGLMMPVPTSTFGALVAICLAIPLRIRRYAYAPVPPRSLAWAEGLSMLGCLIAILMGSRWT